MIVVGDTCTLLYLLKSRLYQDVAKYYEKIYIPEEVNKELKLKSNEEMQLIFNKPEVINVKEYKDIENLDEGESAAICLYNEINAEMILTDDKKALKYCERNNIETKSFKDLIKLMTTVRDISEEIKFIKNNVTIMFPTNSLDEV